MTTYVKEQTASEVAASNGNADLGAYNPAWDVALQCFQQNLDDIRAIQTVYKSMRPPASLPLLATVIGAIYADTYWTGTQLDPGHLSASLRQAEGFNKHDCDIAAQAAFKQWYGLLVRDNFGSNGRIPKPIAGGVTLSPDVLCNAAGSLTPSQLLTMWNSYFFNGSTGTKSYCYGRAQSVNIPLPITRPELRMFFTDAGFLPPPNSWIQMFTFSGSTTVPMEGMKSGPITPQGGRAANGVDNSGDDAFNFQPQGAGHYCLIAVVSTEFFTNTLEESAGNWDSMMWLRHNGAAGWHNIDVQTNDEEVLKFYNQDGRPERFVFEAHCANVPAGTKVSLRSTGGGLVANVESGDVKIYKGQQVVRAEGVAPASYTGELVVKIDTPDGKLLPAGASVQVRKLWAIEQGHPHHAQAAELLRAHREASQGQTLLVPMGDYTFVGAAE